MTISLEDFVSDGLIQIIRGVKKAQELAEGTGASISPHMRTTKDPKSVGDAEGLSGQPCYKVEFDVAVTVNEQAGSQTGIGVVAGVFGLGARAENTDAYAKMSRLQFSVPVVLPLQEPPKI